MQVADTNMDTVNMPGEKNVVTGRKVLAWIIAFFGVVFVANGVFLWLALTSFSGIEATSAYKAGLGFEQERAAAAEQNDRGWQVSADIARSGTGADIRIHARDKDGAPIRDVMFLATFKRPAQDREDHALALSQVEPGVYAARLIDSGLRPEMVEEVRRHVAAGHRTLFVSASLEDYLLPIARYLGMSGVIAVELERRDGRLTGRLAAPNVRAEQKAVRLREHLGAPSSGPLEGIELWAYGNSSGDHALLEMADHALWLGAPEKRPPGVEQYGPTTAFGTSSSGR